MIYLLNTTLVLMSLSDTLLLGTGWKTFSDDAPKLILSVTWAWIPELGGTYRMPERKLAMSSRMGTAWPPEKMQGITRNDVMRFIVKCWKLIVTHF